MSTTSATPERPIIFSGEMVRAILEGRKTQTRRVIGKEQPWPEGLTPFPHGLSTPEARRDAATWCPYGQRGDHLWVRENWAARLDQDHLAPRDLPRHGVGYWADGPGKCCNTGCAGAAGKVRPSIHMPRWASRITLEVTEVRVGRVQEISGRDAIAEGVRAHDPVANGEESPRAGFRRLWDSLHAKDGHDWEANPWVWVISFRRIEA